MLYSWLNPPLPANGDKAWFGWPKDDEIEALRKAWLKELKASDSEVRQEIAAEIQERAFETVPYIPTGQYLPKTANRKTCAASSRRRPCLCGTSRKSSSIVCDVA
jgi:ABC-type transport system substrate-binding protein